MNNIHWCQVAPESALQNTALCSPFLQTQDGYHSNRVSVYIDGANFLYGIKSINERYTDFKFDFESYIKKIVGQRYLVSVYYYNASLKQQINPESFRKQQQFFARLVKIHRFNVILCKRQRRTNKDGKEFFTIKGDDIHLAIDMLRDAYENKYDTSILISGDGDFAPLVRQVKMLGKMVENYHFEGNISLDLLKECDMNAVISKKIANKFFLRR